MAAVVLVMLAAATGGCTSVNEQLNDQRLPTERRALNFTRAATGVGVAPIASTPPARVRPDAPRRETNISDLNPDGCFVGLALSGGGSRSANFSAACMFELQRIGMLQRVDYISSVSGGSLTAAYYCLFGDGPGGWNPGEVQKKLTHSFASDLIIQTLVPWNLPALWFTDWDRSDILADAFTHELFSRKGRKLTFRDLRPDRPRLLINATDLQSGRRFVFCNEMFDELNSDLSRYPVSHAVAASAAVPVLMHHVTLRDFSTTFKQYRHLIDGGVVDNLGVQSLVETYTAQVDAAASSGKPDPYPRGAIIIVLDARTEFDARLSNKGDISFIESLSTGAGLTSTALLNRVSSANLADLVVRNAAEDTPAGELRDAIKKLEEGGSLTLKSRGGKPVRVIHVALSRVDDLTSLPSRGFREQVNSIATYFNISSAEAFNLYEAAELLFRERFGPELVKLREELDAPGR
jgi:predicted acylesterase/phospholipase RssA